MKINLTLTTKLLTKCSIQTYEHARLREYQDDMDGVVSSIKAGESQSHKVRQANMARLHSLMADVFARSGLPVAKRFSRLLDGACTAYGMDHAYITMIGARACTIAYSSTNLVPIASTEECTTTAWIVTNTRALGIPDAPKSPYAGLQDQTGSRPGCFLGAPIEFDGRIYGTLELLGKHPRPAEFSDIEISTVRMLSLYAAVPLILLGQR